MKKVIRGRVRQIIAALRKYDPEKVVLFGSAARGDADRFSDVDIVVIKETDERFLDRLGRVYDLIEPDFALDVLVYTPQEFRTMQERASPFIEHVVKEGITIYERPKGRSRALAQASRIRPPSRTVRRGRGVSRERVLQRATSR